MGAGLAQAASQKGVDGIAGLKRSSAIQTSVVPAFPSSRAAPSASDSLTNPSIKPIAAKKATLVFQDQEPSVSSSQPPSLAESASFGDAQHKNPRHYKSQPYLKSHQQPVLRRTQSKHFSSVLKLIDVEDDLAEAAYEDAVEQLPQNIENVQEKHLELADEEQNVVVHGESEAALYQLPTKDLPPPSAISEPEEYWDDEDDQEPDLYDEQGFTTAHSYRSHGDNTTGGPTTMIAPRVTINVQKELEMAKAVVMQNQSEEEVEEEAWDVSMVAEYGDEIFEYMRDLEVSWDFMRQSCRMHESLTLVVLTVKDASQPALHGYSDRDPVVDAIRAHGLARPGPSSIQPPSRNALPHRELHRPISSVKVVSLGKLQLVGATAIFVAAKYEEINCPSVQEIVYMVDQGYSVEEILKAERFMLAMLNFELGWPGPMSFLRRISKADDYDLETRTLAKYFLEVTIMDERFVSSPPSYLAAGAHCLARMMLKKGDWVSFGLPFDRRSLNTHADSGPCSLFRLHHKSAQASRRHDLGVLPRPPQAPQCCA